MSQPIHHKAAWQFGLQGSSRLRELVKLGGTNRLRELLKLYGCEDVVTPVDEVAFGRRSSELIRRGRELQRKQFRYEDEGQGEPSSKPSFVRPPKPSAKQRARDAAAAMADYKAEQLATLAKTARLKKLRLEKEAADDAKATASGRGK